jgi:hypothetical protein
MELDIYSKKYYNFINDNLYFRDNIDTSKLMNIFNMIKKPMKQIKKTKSIKLHKLRKKTDDFLLMELLKRNSKYKKYTDDKQTFIKWMIQNYKSVYPFSISSLLNVDDNRKPIHRLLYDNPFVSINIHNYYETNNVYYEKYNIDNTELHLYQFKNMPRIDVSSVFHIINVIRTLTGLISKKLQLILLLTPCKKKILNNFNTIYPISINSGSAYPNRYINIWRYEEWTKVLIHELVHYFKIDSSKYNYYPFINYIKSQYNIEGTMLPNESYTEIIAVLIHCCYISKTQKQLQTYINLERNFSLFQAAKIIHLYPTIRQTTSVFSYYILKACVFNSDTINMIFSDITKLNGDKYTELMKISFKSNIFNDAIKYYTKLISNKSLSPTISLSMRMTCLQV